MSPNLAVSAVPGPDLPDPAHFSREERRAMLAAGQEIQECHRVLRKAGLNVVGEVLRGQGEFVELEHYPRDDVFDVETHGQYYYHAHRESGEHGHFHLFVRAGAFPPGTQPIDFPQAAEPWPEGKDAIAHIVAISMDAWGFPTGLFATNRWVTDETWHWAETVAPLIDLFAIDHAFPNWSVNRWITAMTRLFRPHIESLLRHRDRVIAHWMDQHPEKDIFEMRELDVTGHLPVSVEAWIDQLRQQEAA